MSTETETLEITSATVGQTDLYRVWNGEDAYLYLYDYFVVARVEDGAVEYRHRHMFRSLASAEELVAKVLDAGAITLDHWDEVRRMTTEERFAELSTWERKHDEIHGHW